MSDINQAIKWMQEGKEVVINGKETFSGTTEEFLKSNFELKDDYWSLCNIQYSDDNWIMPMYDSMSNQIVLVGNPTEETIEYYSRYKLCGYDKVEKMINLILEDNNKLFDKFNFSMSMTIGDLQLELEKIIKNRFGK